ncbi:hypothetical protein BDV25DRAFT_149016 [Aspergillus avenaceus]|uniref:Uncharacterized protein n=1 Tax=Aspergillus avenaceus TaxID=36643 RepID=A0A5N6U564_ASPAV|nr:hypothetical protein BDV25DRAFT_149016 [Aspergillus avenaceus]
MELPTYTVPESLLSRQPVPPSRSLRRSSSELDDLDIHSRTAGKRRCTSAESLPSPLSHIDLTLRAPTTRHDGPARHHDISTTMSHPELSIGAHSRSNTGGLALNAHREVQMHSPLSTPLSAKQSEEVFSTGPDTRQSLDGSTDFPFPFQTTTATQDLDMKYNCFLDMPDKKFFPTPSMTDTQEEALTSILTWNATTQSGLLDDAAPDRYDFAPDPGEYVLDAASTEARLLPVLKAVAAAGFDSLDSALVAYYTKSVKEDDRLGQEQRLNRIRRLPVLLKELHLASEGWGQWQRRSFQEQVIKSTEDILIAELENHLAARGSNPHPLTGGGGPSSPAFKHRARDEADIEAEVRSTPSSHPCQTAPPFGHANWRYSSQTHGPC